MGMEYVQSSSRVLNAHLSPAGMFIMVNNASPNADTLSSINSEYSTSLK